MQKRAPVPVSKTSSSNITNANKGYDKPWMNNSKPNKKTEEY
jgi:hypothetical protein